MNSGECLTEHATTHPNAHHLARMDAGMLREHLAAYLLATYGTAPGSPLLSGDHKDLTHIIITDTYAAGLARRLARRLGGETTYGYLKRGFADGSTCTTRGNPGTDPQAAIGYTRAAARGVNGPATSRPASSLSMHRRGPRNTGTTGYDRGGCTSDRSGHHRPDHW